MLDFEELKVTFFQECAEYFSAFEDQFAILMQSPVNSDVINDVFRSVHSIKGGAAAFGLEDVVTFAHRMENVLDLMRSGQLSVTKDRLILFMRAVDILSDLVNAAKRDEEYINPAKAELLLKLEELERAQLSFRPSTLMKQGAAPSFPVTSVEADRKAALKLFKIRLTPQRGLYFRANEPQLLFRELQEIGDLALTCHCDCPDTLEGFDPFRPVFSWDMDLKTTSSRQDIEEIFEFVEDDCLLTINEIEQNFVLSEQVEQHDQVPINNISLDDLLADLDMGDAAPAGGQAGESTPVKNITHIQDHQGQTGEVQSLPDHLMTVQPVPIDMAGEPASGEEEEAVQEETQNFDKLQDMASFPASSKVDSIRVDLEKIDKVINMVGEIVITQSILRDQLDEDLARDHPEMIKGIDILAQHTRQLQDYVMAIRAQPVKTVFNRLPRLIRELSEQTGKKVHLEIEGESTEIDKTVIEKLVDPLMHMVRNAVDHGIESPDVRREKGKSETGTLRLSAHQQGDKIHVSLSDDGQGLHADKLFKRAVERQLIPADARLSEDDILNLIFMPGFSTASDISNISGRGVGMDVVRQNIHKLGGRIVVDSVPDKGTRVSMILPLTLAVMDVMKIEISGVHYVLPVNVIVESFQSIRIPKETIPAQGRVMPYRDGYISILDLADLLGLSERPECATDYMIVCHVDGQEKIAFRAHAILGQQQVVIKSLEEHYHSLPGISGATILGDGNVALILDLEGLIRLHKKQKSRPMAA
jgi:two-component system chemotaxis sensor kinase CheA